MGLLRWQWTLANRGVVTAVLNPEGRTECVLEGDRIVSECVRGAKPDGHTITVTGVTGAGESARPPIEAVISFDPVVAVCILRVDGHEVGPTAWPVKEKKVEAVRSERHRGIVLIGAFLLLAPAAYYVTRAALPAVPAAPDKTVHGTMRSMNGLFIAHYTPDLEARPAVVPAPASALVLEDKDKRVTIVLVAVGEEKGTTHEAWSLQQRLREEALANVPKGIARFEETARRDERCFGEKGAVVVGRLAHKSSLRGRVWSCAFAHDGAGYFALYSVAEPADPAAEERARAVVDATELTHLADLGAVPDPSALPSPSAVPP